MTARDRRVAVVLAGHGGDVSAARAGLTDDDPSVRAAAVHALERLDALTDGELAAAAADVHASVRRIAAEMIARRPGADLLTLLHDDDPTVVEMSAWAAGEHERVSDAVVERLVELTTTAEEPLVREAGAAALGAIGDERGLPAILTACEDRPHVRRRAVLALAPFDGPAVDAALERASQDRDWQVRQSADDLLRVIRAHGDAG